MVGRLSWSVLPKSCFLVVRRQLQRPPPIQIRPFPRRRQTTPQIHISAVDTRVFSLEMSYRTSRAEDLDVGVHVVFLKALRT
jgi:hypothetical protein